MEGQGTVKNLKLKHQVTSGAASNSGIRKRGEGNWKRSLRGKFPDNALKFLPEGWA